MKRTSRQNAGALGGRQTGIRVRAQPPDSIHRGCLQRDEEVRTCEARDAEQGRGEALALEALRHNGEVLERVSTSVV